MLITNAASETPTDTHTQIAHPGNLEPRSLPVVIVVDRAQASSLDHFGMFSGYQWESLRAKILRAGIPLDRCSFRFLADVSAESLRHSIVVSMGEGPLRALTGKKGIDKWQLSPLETLAGGKIIPTFDLIRTQKQYELGLYIEFALRRAQQESLTHNYARTPENFRINPPLDEAIELLKMIAKQEEVSCDVETGYGQINTVGFAWSNSDAIAINVLPDRCGDPAYYELWRGIAAVLQSPARKTFQNFIYDVSYFSAYGIETQNISWDTMWAMKLLWPELKSNLGNVGRIYTNRVYWKDDGKATDEESGKRDWGNVRDWGRHYLYNCRDTVGTFEAAHAQRKDLMGSGLLDLYQEYLIKLAGPILEMCSNGMPVDRGVRESLRAGTAEKLKALTEEFHREAGSPVNPRSPKQVMNWLREAKVKLPKKYDKATGSYKESADASSLKKVALKHPELKALKPLALLKSLDKAMSSYIDAELRPDGRAPYSINGTGTETLRFSSGKDPWDRGFNIQTIPREGGDVSIKSMFVAPAGMSFLEVDLRQAESRFVAYDAADKTLIEMLESGADVHSHVGKAILRQMGRDPTTIPKDEFKQTWRQLGKKAGHGLNYGMKASVFMETVFNELDMVISKKDAEAITLAYYGLFPGIPKWHQWVRNELYNRRKLTTPWGLERYYYGRPGDDMNKEGYSYRPQSTIPYITNRLMLHLCEERKAQRANFHLIYQGHDALVMLVPEGRELETAALCHNLKNWHPTLDLPGGRLVIPVETKAGKVMASLEEIEP